MFSLGRPSSLQLQEAMRSHRILPLFSFALTNVDLLFGPTHPLVAIILLLNILSDDRALSLKHLLGWYHHSHIYIFYRMNYISSTNQRRICRDRLYLFLLLLPFGFFYWYFIHLVHNGTCCRNNDFFLIWVGFGISSAIVRVWYMTETIVPYTYNWTHEMGNFSIFFFSQKFNFNLLYLWTYWEFCISSTYVS